MKIVNSHKRKRFLPGLRIAGGYLIMNYFKPTWSAPSTLIVTAISYGFFCCFIEFFIDLCIYKGWYPMNKDK